jgi:hypothetical protein
VATLPEPASAPVPSSAVQVASASSDRAPGNALGH